MKKTKFLYEEGNELVELEDEQTMEKVIVKMFEIGEKRGIKKGKKEGKIEALLEVAKNMLNHNMDISTVMSLTGLTMKQLQNLK